MSLGNNEIATTEPDDTVEALQAPSATSSLTDLESTTIQVRDTRPLLILDLDETLIYGTEDALPDQNPITKAGPYSIYARPHVQEFLDSVRQDFRLAVWTAANLPYAAKVTSALFNGDSPLEFTFTDSKCINKVDPESQEVRAIKDLKKVKRSKGEDLAQVLIIDDKPEGLTRNYGNLIRVRPFTGDASDTDLLKLSCYLKDLASQEIQDFRRLEKRGWINKYQD